MSLIPFVSAPVTTWDPRGFFWCAMSGAYDIVQLRAGRGDTVLRITRQAPPIPVTAAERDAAVARVKETFKDFPGVNLDFSRIPRVKPLLQSLHIDDGGYLWAGRTTADTTASAFDVFDRSGTHIATVEARFAPVRYFRPTIRGDHFYAMVRDGELPAIKIGKKGHWRVERARLEDWIAAKYVETAEYVRSNPLVEPAES